MKISVIIPTFNRAHTVGRAIRSVMDQSDPPHELIVVDDGSTDETQALLASFTEPMVVIRNNTNRGVSLARNLGIQAATGDWLTFLDSDDEWHRDKLKRQTQFHARNPQLLISQCDEVWIRNGVKVNPMVKHAKQGGWIFDECIPLCIVSPSAVIINAQIFKEVGLFDEQLPACEDYDLWLRIAPHYEIGLLDEKLVTRHGGHPDQLSRKYWGMDRFRIAAMEKQIETPMDSKSKRKLLEHLAFKCNVVANGADKREKQKDAAFYFKKEKKIRDLLDSDGFKP